MSPPKLALAGVPVYVDLKHGISDTRLILIDNQTIATGSYNLSEASEYENCENLIVLHDLLPIQAACENHFRQHLQRHTVRRTLKTPVGVPSPITTY